MISFLVSVRGTAKYLPDLLQSISVCGAKNQVLVRANGKDQWDEVGKQLVGFPKVQFVKNWEVLTLSESLNDLAEIADGPWVMRIDPDDLIPAAAIPIMLRKAKDERDVVYGHYQDFGRENRVIHCKQADPNVLWLNSIGPYNFLTSRKFMLHVRWKEIGYEDWNMYMRMWAAGGIFKPQDYITMLHRVREGGRSEQFARDHMARVDEMHEANEEFFWKRFDEMHEADGEFFWKRSR